jgi:two-component system chemotaxis response regulator CheY
MAFDLSMSILVVDDYATMIRIIRNLLKQLGFENVDDASDGSAALAKMQVKKYELVISDWNMEPMTGYDLLREVRASPELSKTPFIMITAESKTENVIAAKKAGVSNYIVKPFNAATLKTKMEAVFGPGEQLFPRGQRGPPNRRIRARSCMAAREPTRLDRGANASLGLLSWA